MAKTSLKAEVANSYLNWIWWVLEPLASMLVYYLIFSHILGRGQEYYVVFIYTGTLVWSYFDRCMLFAVQSIRLNRDIVTKTYIPKPMLILQGSDDLQATIASDYKSYQELLGDHQNVTFRLYDGLNHAFVSSLSTDPSKAGKEFSKERHIPSVVIDDIAAFIQNN